MLKVGKVYRHGSDSQGEDPSLFIITERWSPDLFMGTRTYDGETSDGSVRWAFDGQGNALGYANNHGKALNWKIIKRNEEYEVALIYPDTGMTSAWETVNKGSAWTSRTKYLVRKKHDFPSVKLMSHDEFLEFLDDYLG